jgi:hypothetical protein
MGSTIQFRKVDGFCLRVIHSYVSNLRRLLGGAGYDPNKVLAPAIDPRPH